MSSLWKNWSFVGFFYVYLCFLLGFIVFCDILLMTAVKMTYDSCQNNLYSPRVVLSAFPNENTSLSRALRSKLWRKSSIWQLSYLSNVKKVTNIPHSILFSKKPLKKLQSVHLCPSDLNRQKIPKIIRFSHFYSQKYPNFKQITPVEFMSVVLHSDFNRSSHNTRKNLHTKTIVDPQTKIKTGAR